MVVRNPFQRREGDSMADDVATGPDRGPTRAEQRRFAWSAGPSVPIPRPARSAGTGSRPTSRRAAAPPLIPNATRPGLAVGSRDGRCGRIAT